MSSQSAPAERSSGGSSLAFNMAGIAVMVLLLAVGAAYLVDEMGAVGEHRVPRLNDGDPIIQTISGTELSIPTSWFRYGEQIKDGFTNQIDLRVMFGDADAARPIDITLLPRSRARASASLLDAVYLHQFGDQTLSGVPGLVGKPMFGNSGFANESVWYDALSPNPFVAKCLAPVTPDGASQCVRTVYLPSGIAAVYTFDASLLQSWRAFDTQAQKWLTPIGAW
ncbi:hypothetical protein [Devosia sp. 2618]|uniref:hypothetical protein n=1 Tax=Devosia sp. 2618 TaxID=3156454 RepID=UPI003397F1E2